MTEDSLTNYKKMLKFIRGKGPGSHSSERAKVQKDLYAFRKLTTHGFPSKPTALAYDPVLKLIAIGNKSGAIRVLGRPGVEFSGQHPNDEIAIIKVVFVPKQGHVITLTDDNSLHLWQIRSGSGASLQFIKSYPLDGKIKKISCLRVKENQTEVYVGTEGGNVYTLDVAKFELSDQVIYLDVVLQNAPENYKINPGAVEAVLEVQEDLVIGYDRGLIIKWSRKLNKSLKYYIQNQQLESLALKNNNEVLSSHNDGSYITWDLDKETNQTKTVYGPYPCKKISKIAVVGDLIAFSGGLPRASDGDHHSVSVLSPTKHVVFDLTSRIVDFEVIEKGDAVIILAEEELVAVDLTSEDWPVFRNPYLNSVHPSAVTCFHYSPLNQEIDLSGGLDGTKYSENMWPIKGGECAEMPDSAELFITGHEDGSVRFWESRGSRMLLLAKFSCAELFAEEAWEGERGSLQDDEEEWPPYRKVGTFDPYSDDPRLAVQKLLFCPKSGFLAIGGTAGQLLIVNTRAKDQDAGKIDTVNLVAENFVWKGHDPLKCNKLSGVHAVLQIHPPAAVTALALEGSSGLVAIGTGHGLVLYEFIGKRVLYSKSTLNPSDVMASGDVGMSRRKSFKKSLRESFRRLRKGRSQRNIDNGRSPTSAAPAAQKPVERAIEARSGDDAMSSMVRTLCFARTYIISFQTTTPTLWVGTNAGTVFVFCIQMSETRSEITCLLGKEIQLKHRAPVLSIIVLDGQSSAIDSFTPPPNGSAPHRVLIGSEEQIKIFTLPNLRPFGKLKLTAQEGARVRRLSVAVFRSVSDTYSEKCLCCLTNQGDLYVITLPDLKRQLSTKCLRKEDISGISSLVFTTGGHAIFMCSSSEMQRITLSSKYDLPCCSVPGIDGDATSVDRNDFSLKAESLDLSGDITIDVVTDHLAPSTTSNGNGDTSTAVAAVAAPAASPAANNTEASDAKPEPTVEAAAAATTEVEVREPIPSAAMNGNASVDEDDLLPRESSI